MNKWIGIGRLVADPELKQAQSGSSVAKYRLAVDRQRSKDGQKEADFINCVAFGKSADFAAGYFKKGTKIAVEGRIQTGSYTKDDGTTVYTTDIIIERQEFCESKSASGGQSASDSEDQNNNFEEVESDDLPF